MASSSPDQSLENRTEPDELFFDDDSNICLMTIMTQARSRNVCFCILNTESMRCLVQERLASLHRMLAVWDGWISIAMLLDDYAASAEAGFDLLAYDGQMPALPQRIVLSVVQVGSSLEPCTGCNFLCVSL